MNIYIAIGLVAVALWVAVTYIELKIDGLINENMRRIENRASEVTRLLEETNALLKEIKEIEFEIDGSDIKNKNKFKKNIANLYKYEHPFKKLNEVEAKIKDKEIL